MGLKRRLPEHLVLRLLDTLLCLSATPLPSAFPILYTPLSLPLYSLSPSPFCSPEKGGGAAEEGPAGETGAGGEGSGAGYRQTRTPDPLLHYSAGPTADHTHPGPAAGSHTSPQTLSTSTQLLVMLHRGS